MIFNTVIGMTDAGRGATHHVITCTLLFPVYSPKIYVECILNTGACAGGDLMALNPPVIHADAYRDASDNTTYSSCNLRLRHRLCSCLELQLTRAAMIHLSID